MRETFELIREGFIFILTCALIIAGAVGLKLAVLFVGYRYPHATLAVCCTALFLGLCWFVGYAREYL